MTIFHQVKSKEHKKLNAVFGSIALGLLMATTYLTFTQHQFAIAINLWQAKMMADNKYFPVFTIFLLALPPLLVLLAVKLLVLKLMKK